MLKISSNLIAIFTLINNNKVMKKFRGYKQSKLPKSDETISQTDPGTSCGEYLRRYWHPVALNSEVSTTPLQIRILGEDLVIFKTWLCNSNFNCWQTNINY